MAGITGVDHELNSALPIPPWTLAIPATFAKSLTGCPDHGGADTLTRREIQVQSTPGNGTTVTAWVPLALNSWGELRLPDQIGFLAPC